MSEVTLYLFPFCSTAAAPLPQDTSAPESRICHTTPTQMDDSGFWCTCDPKLEKFSPLSRICGCLVAISSGRVLKSASVAFCCGREKGAYLRRQGGVFTCNYVRERFKSPRFVPGDRCGVEEEGGGAGFLGTQFPLLRVHLTMVKSLRSSYPLSAEPLEPLARFVRKL